MKEERPWPGPSLMGPAQAEATPAASPLSGKTPGDGPSSFCGCVLELNIILMFGEGCLLSL